MSKATEWEAASRIESGRFKGHIYIDAEHGPQCVLEGKFWGLTLPAADAAVIGRWMADMCGEPHP